MITQCWKNQFILKHILLIMLHLNLQTTNLSNGNNSPCNIYSMRNWECAFACVKDKGRSQCAKLSEEIQT